MVDDNLKELKKELAGVVTILKDVTEGIGHEELLKTVTDLSQRIDDPFMFVIVGEVKAGKSSFINALLESDKEICKVAASPMTDTIQQIVYGDKETVTDINTYLKRITQPVDILKDIAIVDTPGTNTIIDHHQEITESFIPASDLIVFVFESKNPYRQSAWDFFNYINKDWHKKIIFVLQQKDLMNEEDLNTNITGVEEYAKRQGIMSPIIFPVSALLEQQGHIEMSGFKKIRNYIANNITGGQAPYLKMVNNADTILNINDRIVNGVKVRKEQYVSDFKFREDIKLSLNHQEEKTKRQVAILVTSLLAAYDKITKKKRTELGEGIGFVSMLKRSFKSTFGGGQSVKEWLTQFTKDLEYHLNTHFRDKLQEGVVDIADNIQNMGKIIDLKIRNSETILKNNHEIFADIAEKRANILRDLQEAFSGFLKRSENFYDSEMVKDGENLVPNIAKGGGIAIVGVILTALTQGVVFDITGGILTGIGVLFAGVTIGLNKGKIMRTYDKAVAEGRDQIEEEISQKLNAYTLNIKEKINDNFYKFDNLLEEEKATLEKLELSTQNISVNVKEIKQNVQSLYSSEQ